MSLKGIDISSWQETLDLSRVNCDLVIVKVTEGIDYVNATCDSHVQQALALGKKMGFYHYAQNGWNSPQQEAAYFLNHAIGYFGKGIPVLDWEEQTHDVAWALEWLQIVERATGVKPLIYMSESKVNKNDWSSVVANGNGLWVAKYKDYSPVYNYDMSNIINEPKVNYWPFYMMWQFTSSGCLDGYNGNLDCNIFYGDSEAWDKYTKNSGPVPTPLTKHQIGEYVEFDSCYASSTATIGWPPLGEALVPDIHHGVITHIYDGTNNPYLINKGMCFVNDGDIKQTQNTNSKVYTVQVGDTLWDIANKQLGDPTRYKDIMDWNVLDSDTIYPGQELKLYK